MDRYDPNQWTKDFVAENKDFCLSVITDTNNQVIELLKSGEHKAAIAGLDRILNGLVTMINAGFDYRSQACFFSWIEASVMLFGNLQEASEQNRILTAKEALLDARDFAKSEAARSNICSILDDINRGYDLFELSDKYEEDFPNFEAKTLADLNSTFKGSASASDSSASSASSKPSSSSSHSNSSHSSSSHSGSSRSGSSHSSHSGSRRGRKTPWWLIIVIICSIILVPVLLTILENEVKSPALAETFPPIIATTQSPINNGFEGINPEESSEFGVNIPFNENGAIPENLVGKWEYSEIVGGAPNADGSISPDKRKEMYYTFSAEGECSFGNAEYLEADKNDQDLAEYIDGMYWICVGGGGQSGRFTVSEHQITITTDDSVQYGPSTTTAITFTLEGDTLTLHHDSGSISYTRIN